MRANLVGWQWSLYAANHQKRSTLLVHLFAVPLFCTSLLGAVAQLASGRIAGAAASLGGVVVGFALQAIVHKREPVAPVPFEGPGDGVSRILVEQFFTFWRFLLSGGWGRAWRDAR